jgi:hypothetical protein
MSLEAGRLAVMSAAELPQSTRFAGIVTAVELASAGLSRARIRRLVSRGELTPLGRGVYARTQVAASQGPDDQWTDRLLRMAGAVAVSRKGTVVSHRDAAIIHGLTLLDHPPSDVAVTRLRDAAGSRTARPGIGLHIAALPVGHITVCQGIPVTTVARTVIDIARTTAFKAGVVTADSALHTRQTSVAQLSAVMWDCDRWPGIRRAREVVAFSDPRAESAFESIARVAFRDGGLPPPMLQVWVGDNDRMIGRVDFLWSDQWTIAEADGAAKYADPDLARKQLWRDTELRRAGYEVVHFTWRDLASDPAQVVQSIRLAFVRAARLRGRG